MTGRPKHIYSIYSKMQQKGLEFDELYDVRGLRVLVDTVKDCYTVLGIVHNLWEPIPKEFDDYISRPKGNGYRSLHTAVAGADARSLEVQIRTHEMHRHAELGVAAHWRYKEGKGARDEAYDDKIAWLRQVLAWRDEVVGSADWVEQSKRAALDDTVYVLTPQGQVIDLPRGATPIDFAYALHTDLGHRCRGAKVDGAMVPLDFRLDNGQRVEIVAAKAGGPSRDWLNQQGYLASTRARNKVRQWFNAEELARTVAAGRAVVEREIAREGATSVKLETLATQFGFAKADELFAAVGREEIGPRALQIAVRGPGGGGAGRGARHQEEQGRARGERHPLRRRDRSDDAARALLQAGAARRDRRLRHARARHLGPPARLPEPRAASRSATRARDRDAVGRAGTSVFPVDIAVQAHDRQGLLRDISEVLSRERINVTAVNTQSASTSRRCSSPPRWRTVSTICSGRSRKSAR